MTLWPLAAITHNPLLSRIPEESLFFMDLSDSPLSIPGKRRMKGLRERDDGCLKRMGMENKVARPLFRIVCFLRGGWDEKG
ncbi:hypothetical protein TNCT_61751 [Trichonephila clavata]|uniref:Uncharacterized protein n=1 Tax=Trichonephila clavata TaxID=2740835 RepID=A0A8X6L5E7_TRICU|nr:hypothetical protein TNCT_61751 [Trichonephila clavata]